MSATDWRAASSDGGDRRPLLEDAQRRHVVVDLLEGAEHALPVAGTGVVILGPRDPTGAAAHVRESLNTDGTWSLVEPFANDDVEKNLNPLGRVFYSVSTLVSTQASLSQEFGAALGAQAGEALLHDIATKAVPRLPARGGSRPTHCSWGGAADADGDPALVAEAGKGPGYAPPTGPRSVSNHGGGKWERGASTGYPLANQLAQTGVASQAVKWSPGMTAVRR